MSRHPISINTSDWGPFDPASANDANCERERQAFTQYTLRRVKKQKKTGSDDLAIIIGGFMSIVQVAFATYDNTPPDSAREALHDLIDFCWLQTAGMANDREAMN